MWRRRWRFRWINIVLDFPTSSENVSLSQVQVSTRWSVVFGRQQVRAVGARGATGRHHSRHWWFEYDSVRHQGYVRPSNVARNSGTGLKLNWLSLKANSSEHGVLPCMMTRVCRRRRRSASITKWAARTSWERFYLESPKFTRTSVQTCQFTRKKNTQIDDTHFGTRRP